MAKEEFKLQHSYSNEFKRKIIKEIIKGKYIIKEYMILYRFSWMSIQRRFNKSGQSVILEEGIDISTLKKSNNMSRKDKIIESDKVGIDIG